MLLKESIYICFIIVIKNRIYSSVSQSISVKSSELKNFSKYLSQKSFLFKDNTLYPILQSFDKSGYIIADSRLMNRQIEALGCIYYSFFKNHLLSHIWVSKTEIQWNNIKKYMSNNFDVYINLFYIIILFLFR